MTCYGSFRLKPRDGCEFFSFLTGGPSLPIKQSRDPDFIPSQHLSQVSETQAFFFLGGKKCVRPCGRFLRFS